MSESYQEISPGIFIKVKSPAEQHCEGKKVYKNEAEAQATADYRSEQIGEGLMPYRCRWCSCWHIGHDMTKKTENVLAICPNGCGQEIYKSKLNRHLDDCVGIAFVS